VLELWKNHYDKLLNINSRLQAEMQSEYEHEDGKMISEPTKEEVAAAINKLKNNKAPGFDGILGELIKTSCEKLIEIIYKLIKNVWRDEVLPREWMKLLIWPLHKKGCKNNCKNYRGICLQPTVYKVLSTVLNDRLAPLAEQLIGSYQAGFRKDKSTTDQIFCIRQIVQKSYELNCEKNHLFIDFKAAYDTIIREELWLILVELS